MNVGRVCACATSGRLEGRLAGLLGLGLEEASRGVDRTCAKLAPRVLQGAPDRLAEVELAGADQGDQRSAARLEVLVDRLVEVVLEAQAEEEAGGGEDQRHDQREDERHPEPDRQTAHRAGSSRRR